MPATEVGCGRHAINPQDVRIATKLMLFRRKNTEANVALPPLSACDANTRALAASLKELPEKNVVQLAEHLLQVCDELSNGNASKTQWVAALQVLEPHITLAAEGLARNEPSEIMRLENYQLQLHFFAVIGERLGATATSFVNVAGSRNKHAPNAQNYLSQAIKFLTRSLLLSAKLYAAPSNGCWQALHKCYQDLQKLDAKKEASNALAYYKAIVALYCLNPQQCDLETLSLLFPFLIEHSEYIALAKKACNQSIAELKPEQDSAPSKYRGDNNTKASRGSLYVKVGDLITACANDQNYHMLQQHLEKALGLTAIRDTQRDEVGSAFNICAGIFAIHKKLSGLASFDDYILNYPGTTAQRAPAFAAKKSIHSYKPNDIWSTPYQTNWNKLIDSGNSTAAVNLELRAAAPSADDAYLKQDITCVNAVNCSLFGLCVNGHAQPLNSYTPGTLLGLQKNTSDNWSIASVRWTRADQKQRQLGIEIVGQSATPCAIKIVHSKHGTDAMPALYIPASDTKSALLAKAESKAELNLTEDTLTKVPQEDWLLFPDTSLSSKTSALLLMDEKIQRIILSKCIEQTSEYCIYAVNLAEKGDEN